MGARARVWICVLSALGLFGLAFPGPGCGPEAPKEGQPSEQPAKEAGREGSVDAGPVDRASEPPPERRDPTDGRPPAPDEPSSPDRQSDPELTPERAPERSSEQPPERASDSTTGCQDGAQRDCYDGPAGTDGKGSCSKGKQSCRGGKWSRCLGQQGPVKEICNNGADDDCNGKIDDGPSCSQAPCGGKKPCVSTFVGPGLVEQGPARYPWFNLPNGLAYDSKGRLYITDTYDFRILRLDGQGKVEVFAGTGLPGVADGQRLASTWLAPHGIAIDGQDNVYVADTHRIRKIDAAGQVTTLAGHPFSAGSTDGKGAAARFQNVTALDIDGQGNLYALHARSTAIRKITPLGEVTTLAKGAKQHLTLAVSAKGEVYVSTQTGIFTIDSAGKLVLWAGHATERGKSLGPRATARFNYISSLRFDAAGQLYVGDGNNGRICLIDAAGDVSLAVGLAKTDPNPKTEGPADQVQASSVVTMAIDGDGILRYLTYFDGVIRRYDPILKAVAIEAGADRKVVKDGKGFGALFAMPRGLALDSKGALWVADGGLRTWAIRKVSPAGVVTTVATQPALATRPYYIALDASDTPYFTTDRAAIYTLDANGAPKLFAGMENKPGFKDGPAAQAQFGTFRGLAFNGAGELLVLEDGRLRKISKQGVVSTLAGDGKCRYDNTAKKYVDCYRDGAGSQAQFHLVSQGGLAIGPKGDIFIADAGNKMVRKVTPQGVVSTVATLPVPSDVIAVDSQGLIFVADQTRLFSVDSAGKTTELVSMNYKVNGNSRRYPLGVRRDGQPDQAGFSIPFAIQPGAPGQLYISDRNNHMIRIYTYK